MPEPYAAEVLQLSRHPPVSQFASGDGVGVGVLNCFIDSSFPARQKLEGICLPVFGADKGCILCATCLVGPAQCTIMSQTQIY